MLAVRAAARRLATQTIRLSSNHGKKRAITYSSTRRSAIPASHDDSALVPFFDQPKSHRSWLSSNGGLFLHKDLVKPSSFTKLADGTLRRAQVLTDRILRARESRAELQLVLKNLDKLSDLLCGVIDLAELIRNAHPDPAWVQSANDAYDTLCEFMNVLNTHVGLYDVSLSFTCMSSSS